MNEPLYLIETECGGPDAAGGGCGAPLGVRKVSAENFALSLGHHSSELKAHNSDEHDFNEDEITDVKLVHRACSSCWRRY